MALKYDISSGESAIEGSVSQRSFASLLAALNTYLVGVGNHILP